MRTILGTILVATLSMSVSGKEVTVNVASVAADKTRILLSNGAEVDGGLFRLAPWGFAFVGDVSVEGD